MPSPALAPLLVAALVGLCVVVQGSVNAIVGRGVSLWLVVVANNVLAAMLALGLYLAQRGLGAEGGLAGLRAELGRVSPLVAISALCGLIIVSGVPFAIRSLGVSRALPVVIGAQLVGALLWDLRAGSPPSALRVGGVALVLLGAILAVRG